MTGVRYVRVDCRHRTDGTGCRLGGLAHQPCPADVAGLENRIQGRIPGRAGTLDAHPAGHPRVSIRSGISPLAQPARNTALNEVARFWEDFHRACPGGITTDQLESYAPMCAGLPRRRSSDAAPAASELR